MEQTPNRLNRLKKKKSKMVQGLVMIAFTMPACESACSRLARLPSVPGHVSQRLGFLSGGYPHLPPVWFS